MFDENSFTPAVMQYLRIKKKYPDCLLLFRMGDFYECFLEDAKVLSEDLQVVLTSRGKGEKKVPLAGIPYHALHQYLKKLIEKGRKVAICEQLEDPKFAKGIVKRDVVRVITPGTLIEESLLSFANNYLLVLSKHKNVFGFALSDVSTGELYYGVTEDLIELINNVLPAEIVGDVDSIKAAERRIAELGIPHTTAEKLSDFDGAELLKSYFGVENIIALGFDVSTPEFYAVVLMANYLLQTLQQPSKFFVIRRYGSRDYVEVDSTTLSNLEVLKNQRDGTTKDTLFFVLDRTRTSMGKRLLRAWLLKPLKNVELIRKRQERIEILVNDRPLRESVMNGLKRFYDVQRIMMRLSLDKKDKNDVLQLRSSLMVILEQRAALLKVIGSVDDNKLQDLFMLVDLLNRSLDDDPGDQLIKSGFDPELDGLKHTRDSLDEWLLSYEEGERRRTGIKNLKVKYNKVFGFFIEITKSNLDKVPLDYERKQTQVGSERFTTRQLREKESEIIQIDERISEKEKQVFDRIVKELLSYKDDILRFADMVAELDVYCSLAEVADVKDYTRPHMHEGYELDLRMSRHPVLESKLHFFVPNDVHMDEEERLFIITGPNMAGKSTLMRQVCLIVLMAHIGSFVPCKKAKIPIVDRIFSRVGARDDISSGQSTFMVEMSETAYIINNATQRSLIILDEIGRGTSTYDGISIAWSIAEYIAENIRAKTLFATHYHQLNSLEGKVNGVVNYHVEVKEEGNKITFTYLLVKGGTDKSYGIHVARLAGLKEEVLKKAEFMMRFFETTAEKQKEHVTANQLKLANFLEDANDN